MIQERLEAMVLPGREADFEAALCEVRQRVFMSRGFRKFTVSQGVERPSTYLVEVLWESLEERADFEDSGRFDRCWALVSPFLAAALRVELFAPRPGLGFQGPGVITDLSWASSP
ncbi:MAG TPA: antibiotic biosynthesis monooxygenase [Kineosporiaceae bacterium]|nr:antibiotic biosynthesis monooxygenase [Kineosporiaceae bacterium]